MSTGLSLAVLGCESIIVGTAVQRHMKLADHEDPKVVIQTRSHWRFRKALLTKVGQVASLLTIGFHDAPRD